MTFSKSNLVVAALVALAALIGGMSTVAAEGRDGRRGKNGPCKAEVEAICGDVERGEGRVKACIEQNLSNFSGQCQERFAKHKERKEARKAAKAKIKNACQADVQNFCADVPDGDRRATRQCMKQHREQLSATCQEALAEAKQHKRGKGKRGKGKRGKRGKRGERGERGDRALN